MLVGTACAWVRAWGPTWGKWIVGGYVEAIRNTPFIIQLFFIFFGLPSLGLRLSPELASVIAMVVNLGAYATEIIRAGIESTPRGQIEAAASLAMVVGGLTFPNPVGIAAGFDKDARVPDAVLRLGCGITVYQQ